MFIPQKSFNPIHIIKNDFIMKNTFSFRRIGDLLRYDWAMEKRRFVLPFVIFAIAYILCTFSTFYPGYSSGHLNNDNLPILIMIFVNSFFSYAQLILILIVTTILHRKFTQPQSSCLYLTLPASPIEKFIVMLLDYVIAFTALYIVYIALFYLTMFIGYLLEPGYNWALNIFNNEPGFLRKTIETIQAAQEHRISAEGDLAQNSTVNLFIDHILSHYTALTVFSLFVNLAVFLYYLILNMCFKHNAQIKSIGIFLLTGFILTIAFIIGFGTYAATRDFTDMNEARLLHMMTRTFDIIYYTMLATVPICLAEGYILYRQIRYKQAK